MASSNRGLSRCARTADHANSNHTVGVFDACAHEYNQENGVFDAHAHSSYYTSQKISKKTQKKYEKLQ